MLLLLGSCSYSREPVFKTGVFLHDQLWARIAHDVKKPPLTVNVIDFDFFGLMHSYEVLGVPLVPKSHDTLEELFRFKRYVERNKVHFAPFLRFH